jgi:hypothetical protein
MKVFIRILISLALGLSLVHAAAFEKTATSGSTSVLISSKKPLGAGTNILLLTLTQDAKAPVNPKVRVKAFMPAMPGMPAMNSEAEAVELGNGKYQVKINLAMSGTWQLHIFITPSEGKKIRVKSSLDF